MSFLRDQLAAARINRIKRRIAQAQARAATCNCPVCQAQRSGGAVAPIAALLRALAADSDPLDDSGAAGAPKH